MGKVGERKEREEGEVEEKGMGREGKMVGVRIRQERWEEEGEGGKERRDEGEGGERGREEHALTTDVRAGESERRVGEGE